jgi:type 1 glutamine amidotransferase
MTRRRGSRAQRSPAIGMVRAVLLGSLAASCVLSEVTIVPSPAEGGGGGTTPNNSGAGGKSPAGAGGSNGMGGAGDVMADGGGGANTAGANTAGANTAGANTAGVNSGGSPSTGGQPEGEGGMGGAPVIDPDSGPFQVLVVSATGPNAFVHASIPNAVALVAELGQTADANLPPGAKPGSQFETTVLGLAADVEVITPAFLAEYRVLFFAHTTGPLFSSRANGADIMAAIEAFMNAGGGWVGVNGTIELEFQSGLWPWCQDNLTGSLPGTHTPVVIDNVLWPAAATIANHPVIRGLPTSWAWRDEWYALDRDPSSAGFSILGTRDSTSVPVVWAKGIGLSGRSVFTTLGHEVDAYSDANFKKLMLQSILWAARRME